MILVPLQKIEELFGSQKVRIINLFTQGGKTLYEGYISDLPDETLNNTYFFTPPEVKDSTIILMINGELKKWIEILRKVN